MSFPSVAAAIPTLEWPQALPRLVVPAAVAEVDGVLEVQWTE